MPTVHYCFAQHLNEVMPTKKCLGTCKGRMRCICKKCKCRKQVSIGAARALVDQGIAEWVIIGKEPVPIKEVCRICLADETKKKSCSNCDKTGEITVIEFIYVRSNDVVSVTMGSGEPGEPVFRSVMAKQTPRVATIEYAHIIRSYVNCYPEDIERIEAYGESNKEFLESLIVPFIPDPWEGRPVLSFGADGRSASSSWNLAWPRAMSTMGDIDDDFE